MVSPPGQSLESGKFYLVPQRCSGTIPASFVDIVINQQSLQEMTPEQISHYFSVIDRSSRYFYSCNSQHDVAITDKLGVVTGLQSLIDRHFPRVKWAITIGFVRQIRAKSRETAKTSVGQAIPANRRL